MKAGWEVKALGDVCDFKGGSQPPKSQFIHEPQPGYVRMLQIRDFKSDEKAVYIPITNKTNQCAETDIMIGRYGASVGQIHRGKSGAYNVALIRTIPDKKHIDQDYLYHYLTSDLFQKPLMSVSKRGAQDGFSKPDIAPFQIPLPPLEEQKRIVSILDEAFEGLDRARENAEANLKSARELFEVFTKTVFRRSGKGWMQCTIGDVITLQRGIDITKKDQRAGQVPVVSSGGVKSYHDTAHTEGPGVIVGRKGSIGSVHFINEAYWPHDTTLWVRDFKGNEPELVYFLLLGIRLAELDTGTANPSLNRNLVHTVPISWPAVHLQPAIVRELADCRDASKTAQLQYTAKLQDISDLRQSLLQKAFAGELT